MGEVKARWSREQDRARFAASRAAGLDVTPAPRVHSHCGGAYRDYHIVLPQTRLYKQIWQYGAKEPAGDLSVHLAYGIATGAAFWLLAIGAGKPCATGSAGGPAILSSTRPGGQP